MSRKFYLSQTDKKIGGVCGGVAEYLDVDPFVVRIITFCAIVFGGISLWVYIIIWACAPVGPYTR